MPQLNPAPWLSIFIFTWVIFLLIIPTKVQGHSFFKGPSSEKKFKGSTLSPWTWPWY